MLNRYAEKKCFPMVATDAYLYNGNHYAVCANEEVKRMGE
jgi:hypothetical protein